MGFHQLIYWYTAGYAHALRHRQAATGRSDSLITAPVARRRVPAPQQRVRALGMRCPWPSISNVLMQL